MWISSLESMTRMTARNLEMDAGQAAEFFNNNNEAPFRTLGDNRELVANRH
jgi:hypothetical protein